ncbi:MAG TPA: hypothetical protein VGM03_02095 [Phycisphaerae bacterium]|jgi:hypothetical protein
MSRTVVSEIPEYLLSRERARRGERLAQWVALLLAFVCIAGAVLLLPVINAQRQQRKFVIDPATIKGLPPEIVLLRRTGALRGLMVVMLAQRSDKAKQEGKVYDATQLASWICKLLPNFPGVWGYHAWDQAYNISVQRYTPEERWKWVYNGIKLLRDQGIQYNPKSIKLYKELGWLFYHKIGDTLDDHHVAYKKELATMMEKILGPPPPVTTSEQVLEHFRPIAEAPSDVDELIRFDPEVRSFVDRLAELDLKPDDKLLEFVARHLRGKLQLTSLLKNPPENEAERLRQRRVALLSDDKYAPARDRLLACVRGAVLRDTHKMDPKLMYRLMQEFGPLDWRTPWAVGLYWSWYGDIVTRGEINLSDEANDSMNTVRNIFFCLDQIVRLGRITFEPNWDHPNQSILHFYPDLRFVDRLQRAYLEYGKAQFGDDPRFIEGTAGPNYSAGHYNILSTAIQALYMSGEPQNMDKAEKYYAYLRNYNRAPDGQPQPRYLVPLSEFVEHDMRDNLETFKGARELIGAVIGRALYELSLGELKNSQNSVWQAKRWWDVYMEDKRTDREGRRVLDPFQLMWADGAVALIHSDRLHPVQKAEIWSRLDEPLLNPNARGLLLDPPVSTQKIIYDRIRDYVVALCDQWDPPLDVTKAFPEPEGMEDYRKAPVQRLKPPSEKEDVSEGERDFAP